jgi:hypothetical protein
LREPPYITYSRDFSIVSKVITYTFGFSSLRWFAVRFTLVACALLEFFLNLHRFLAGIEVLSVLCATMWLQVEEVSTTEFLLVEKVCAAFSNFSRVIPLSQKTNQKLCLFSDGQVHMKNHTLV